jgi:hypothetical protein
MKRVLLISGIAVLVLLVIGGVVFSLLPKQGTGMTQMMEAATVEFAAALADSLQRVEVKQRFELDGLTTRVRLQIKNTGKASCEYKLVEYKLAGQAPREALFPLEVARLDPGQTEEVELTFENVPWEWTDQEASIFESQKSWSRTLLPKDAPPGQKLGVSSNGEWSGSNPVKLDAEAFKNALPILKEQYPKLKQSLSFGATAKLDGDLTTVTVAFSNTGDLPVLDFSISNAKLGGNGDLLGEIDPATPASSPEIRPGESKTFNVSFKNAPWDFSKSDTPFLNLVLECAFRRTDSIVFKGKTFQLDKVNSQSGGKTFMGVSVKRPTQPTGPLPKS